MLRWLAPAWERQIATAIHAALVPVVGDPARVEKIAKACMHTIRRALKGKFEPEEPLSSSEPFMDWPTLLVVAIVAAAVGAIAMGARDEAEAARVKLRSAEEEHAVELLALFANPALPREAEGFGLRPLAFGQDLRLLMNALPSGAVEVEPAATLLNAQQALLRCNPRCVLFSGHTILGTLAFETPEGRLDMHATPDFFVRLLQGLACTYDDDEGASSTTATATANANATSESGGGGPFVHDGPPQAALQLARRAKSTPADPRQAATTLAATAPPGMGPSSASKSSPLASAAQRAVATTGRARFASVREMSAGQRLRRARQQAEAQAEAARLASDGAKAAAAAAFEAHMVELHASAAQIIQSFARGYVVRQQMGRILPHYAEAEVAHLIQRFQRRELSHRPGEGGEDGVKAPARRLHCVILNGCTTVGIGRSLLAALPQLSVVCWESVAEDAAARAFALGFYASLAQQLAARDRAEAASDHWGGRLLGALRRLLAVILPARLVGAPPTEEGVWTRGGARACALRAFQAGCYSYLSAGYRFGDPKHFLHPRSPPHPHHRKPDLRGECEGCTPPVHGSVVLLWTDPKTGEVVEHRGNRTAPTADGGGASMGTVAKVGLLVRALSQSSRSGGGDARMLLRRSFSSAYEMVETVEQSRVAANVISAMRPAAVVEAAAGGGGGAAGGGGDGKADGGATPRRRFSTAKAKLRTDSTGKLSISDL